MSEPEVVEVLSESVDGEVIEVPSSSIIASQNEIENEVKPNTLSDSVVKTSRSKLFVLSSSPVSSHQTNFLLPVSRGSQSQKPKDILDLKNWISESEDSFITHSNVSPSDGEWLPNQQSNSYARSNAVLKDSDPIFLSQISDFEAPRPQVRPSSKQKIPKKTPEDPKPIEYCGRTYSLKELRDVNKVTRRKEDLLSEMILVLPTGLYIDAFDSNRLHDTFVETEIVSSDVPLPIIRWKRKATAKYDSERDIFIPCDPFQEWIKTCVVYLDSLKLINLTRDGKLSLFIEQCKHSCSTEYHFVIMVEGLEPFLTKLKSKENLRFKKAVLQNFPESQSKRRKKQEPEDDIDLPAKTIEHMIDDAEFNLGINIFPVRNNPEAIEWLHSFTYCLSGAIYDKYERNSSISNLGSVKSGYDRKSIFMQMMKQFRLMTEPKVERLYGFFPNTPALYHAYKRSESLGKDDYDRNIVPPSADTAMYKLFTSYNESQVIYD